MASTTENGFGVCRTCLEPIPKQFNLGAGASDCQRKLSTCFPELNLALTSNPTFCNSCTDAVNSSLKFKMLCYQTEVRILKYLQQAGSNITTADLAQIAKANRNESAVVDLHIKEEIKQESENYCMDYTLESNYVQQNVSSQRASTDDSSSHKSGEKVVTTKKCYRKGTGDKIKLYRCHKCPYRSTYILQFSTHLRTHITKSGYRRLRLNNQRKKREKCDRTQKQKKITLNAFNGRNNLKPHRQMHRIENPTICNQKHVVNHKLKHATEKDFQCDRGSMKCSLKSMEIHRRGKLFSCNTCDFSTKYKRSLKSHMVIHATEEFNCHHCDFSTKHKRYLKSHIVNHMVNQSTEKFKCYHCDFSTKYKRNLKRHMVIHMVNHTTENLKCHHCDFSTKYKRSLRRHMIIHTTEEFKCHHCDFSTKHKQYLKRHMVNHTADECTT